MGSPQSLVKFSLVFNTASGNYLPTLQVNFFRAVLQCCDVLSKLRQKQQHQPSKVSGALNDK